MANGTGVEYRDLESAIEAYTNNGMPNFSIWAGTTLKVKYEGDNIDEGNSVLRNFLHQIQQVGTSTVYSLRVYPSGVHNINNKTVYEGSFNFMLNTYGQQRNENGVVVVSGAQAPAANNAQNNSYVQMLVQQITQKDIELAGLRSQLMDAELRAIRSHTAQQIAGLSQPAEPTMQDKLIEMGKTVIEKPDVIEKIFEGLEKLFTSARKSFEPHHQQEQQTVPAGKTEQQTISQTFTMPDEQTPTKEQPADTTTEVINGAEGDALMDRLNAALDTIENKVGTVEMVQAMEQLAAMAPEKLQGLLKMM